ncbi:hypothetical protein [Synechococcus sp. GFB01]|uniref:hypothetical protein n=1 Tax=Synechococcus sp. GFB01 TaxID=1662190 RepID=UPI000AA19478|nr:hypothetical protein [Synechococcus sp. GFB01]
MGPAGAPGHQALLERERWRSALAIGLVLVALCLFNDNLAGNEAGKLALARQQVDPGWIPHDWYLNNSQGYQWLFQQLSGHIVIPSAFHWARWLCGCWDTGSGPGAWRASPCPWASRHLWPLWRPPCSASARG